MTRLVVLLAVLALIVPVGANAAFTVATGSAGTVSGTVPGVRTDTAFSFSAWALPTVATAGSAGSAVASINGTNGAAATLRINAAGRWAMTLSQTDAASPTNDEVASTVAAATGAWTHLAGNLVATNAANTTAENTTGYWRVGGTSVAGWPNRPGSDYFIGVIDEAAVYPSQLSDQQVGWHFHANH